MQSGFKKKTSLMIEVSLWFSLLICGIMFFTGSFVLNSEKEALTRELIKNGVSLAKNLSQKSAEMFLDKDEVALITSIKSVIKEESGVKYIVVTDPKNIIRMSDKIGEQGGKPYVDPAGGLERKGDTEAIRNYTAAGMGDIYDISLPVMSGNKQLGTVYIGFSQEGINRVVGKARNSIIAVTLAVLLLGIVSSLLLVNMIVRPIKKLAEGAQRIGQGDYDTRIKNRSMNELGELTYSFNEMASSLKEKEQLKDAFSSYLSEELLGQAMKDMKSGALRLVGESRMVTVLFSDIRGFTKMSEKLGAEQVVFLLNEYFTEMTEVIQKHNGYVNKFMGDAVMAIFGAPNVIEDQRQMAVKCGMEMIRKVNEMNEGFFKKNGVTWRIGVGINTGEVVVGNIGSKKHLEYTVIGDPVNLASRLEKLNKEMKTQIIISEDTYKGIPTDIPVRDLGETAISGKEKKIRIYEVEV